MDNRRYVRMSTVFPVEFTLSAAGNGNDSAARLLQGFTRDVSAGGMCIEFKSFGKETEKKLEDPQVSLRLTINPSFSKDPIHAQARVVWLKKQESSHRTVLLIGVAYESIDPAGQKRLIAYAKRLQWLPRVTAFAAMMLLAALAVLGFHNQLLTRENRQLVRELGESAEKRSRVAGDLVALGENRRSLESELERLRAENDRLEKGIEGLNMETARLNAQSSSLSQQALAQKTAYENELRSSREREAAVRSQLEDIRQGQQTLRESYRSLEEAGRRNAEAVLEQMTQWLLSHQNRRTGLVASFEGDPSLEDTAFTYDQALAAQAFLLAGKRSEAAAVLSFFDSAAARRDGAFYNSYDTVGGSPQETAVHAGPNLWVGIAALQYERAAGDGRFLSLARRIGDWALRLQDGEGGLRGGPELSWYSTEHNLDAYAFFGMLHRMTGEASYEKAQRRTLEWIKKYAYSNPNGHVNRGKGDSTIATDTFGWSIASLGPAVLASNGFDPEAILDFAEKNCEVSVDFRQPDGHVVQVRGFDFAKAQHLGRGGILSTEWTAQMAVAYRVMARHFEGAGDLRKAADYLEKSRLYLNELQKMIIASPSRTGQGRGCLPYASADDADTGHGWRTPHGSSTGSVAGTAYGLFAWKGHNPFELSPTKGDADAGL